MSRQTRAQWLALKMPVGLLDGLLGSKSKKRPKRERKERNAYRWARGTVWAFTRSQARAIIKQKLGIKPSGRLPVGFHIEHL